MKLFLRTLLFFIGVIIFQSTLTIYLITRIINVNNEADARVELENEWASVYKNYNSWVQALWKNIVRVNKDEKILAFFENLPDFHSDSSLENWFDDILSSSGMDTLILKSQSGLKNDTSLYGKVYFSLHDLDMLQSVKNHPYIEIREINGDIYLIGSFKIEEEKSLQLFLLKRLDKNFYHNLAIQSRSIVFLTTPSNLEKKYLQYKNISQVIMDPQFQEIPYKEIYNFEIGKENYNGVIKKLGDLQVFSEIEDISLVLLMSNEPYSNIILRINKTVIYVSFFVGMITIILSLYFSGRITQPINKLINAMDEIRKGDSNMTIDYKSGSEVSRLLHGFNAMVRQLHQDKITMNNNIQEITFLKDYNEKIIHSLRAGIVVLSKDFTIEKVNSFFLQSFGREEISTLGKNIEELSINVINSTVIKNIGYIFSGKKSTWSAVKRTESHVYEIKLYPLHTIIEGEDNKCVFEINDISRKDELEGKILQAEKLSSLSLLSAGVSHEINNPLSSIMTNVQNLLVQETDEEKLVSLNWIEQESRRIAKIVSELLDFSSSELEDDLGVDVNSCISDIVRLLNYDLKKKGKISINLDLQSNIPMAVIGSNELKQVVINLLQNSIYAIRDIGVISIKTVLSRSSKKIYLRIKDTGCGMDDEVLLHIFDPFYTTKLNGDGTGLGLSILYGIINKNKGSIDVKSTKGKGTTISITIPVLGTKEDL